MRGVHCRENRNILLKFIGKCKREYERMNCVEFHTNYRDECSISLSTNELRIDIKKQRVI